MPKPASFRISSAGDLEVAVIHEAHSLMASIVSPLLYEVVGDSPSQIVRFKTREAFDLFAIRVVELASPSRDNVRVAGAPSNFSMLSGLQWLGPHLTEPSAPALRDATQTLSDWLQTADRCHFWCGGLATHFTLSIQRAQLWNIFGNGIKHSFLRLQRIIDQLGCADSGQPVTGTEVLHVLESFMSWLDGYCDFHSTMLLELVGRVLGTLNQVIVDRWEANGRVNDSRLMKHPADTSEFFQGLHVQVIVFQRYDGARIWDLVPATSSSLQGVYDP